MVRTITLKLGSSCSNHIDRFAAIGCLAAHFPSLAFLEKGTQPAAHNFVVVSQQDTQFHGILPGYGLSRRTDSDAQVRRRARSPGCSRSLAEQTNVVHSAGKRLGAGRLPRERACHIPE